jgi:hypothetical protein
MPQVTRLPEQIKPLLARLLRTNQDGEAIGCRDAINRKLQAAGLDAHDLVERIDATPAPSQGDFFQDQPHTPPPRAECACRDAYDFETIEDRFNDPTLGEVLVVTLRHRSPRSHVGRGRIYRQDGEKLRLECCCGCEPKRFIKWASHERVQRESDALMKRSKKPNTS